jgi:hypothetical protein
VQIRVLVGGLFLCLLGCTTSGPETQFISDAAAAMGGTDGIAAIETLVLEGRGNAFNLGQNRSPDGEVPRFEVTQYRRNYDLSVDRVLPIHGDAEPFSSVTGAAQTETLAAAAESN